MLELDPPRTTGEAGRESAQQGLPAEVAFGVGVPPELLIIGILREQMTAIAKIDSDFLV